MCDLSLPLVPDLSYGLIILPYFTITGIIEIMYVRLLTHLKVILLHFKKLYFTDIAPYEDAGTAAGSPAASRERKPPQPLPFSGHGSGAG